MRAVPEELTTLISDLENYLTEGLKGENLSKKAKERREAFIKRIKEVKQRYVCGDDSDYEEEVDSNNDGGSLQSERTDKDEETFEGSQQSPPVAAQDLPSVFKAGYLEKRRKGWCSVYKAAFLRQSKGKGDKQQKGEFSIDGYTVKMNNTLRKDAKKDCCFEISAPDKRLYQFCASSPKEAEEWVKQIDFVLRDMSGIIPEEDEEDQEMYDDVGNIGSTAESAPIDDDIYEELPEDDAPAVTKPPPPKIEPASKPPAPPLAAVDKSADYQNYYQGLWDCSGDHPDELSFKRGDAIYILSKEYQNFGWWIGEKNGVIGIVPKDYLMELYAL
uniref:Src kinase associated phosphoprotein 2 n=1 Tax=Amphilophus citrinellus TaxID=61819 RepID=A0A3Q0SKB9_AMPCI